MLLKELTSKNEVKAPVGVEAGVLHVYSGGQGLAAVEPAGQKVPVAQARQALIVSPLLGLKKPAEQLKGTGFLQADKVEEPAGDVVPAGQGVGEVKPVLQ